MGGRDNATWLFEGTGAGNMPHNSESFWTSLFALFVLHLAKRGTALTVWQCKEPTDGRYYELRHSSSSIALSGVQVADISIEPPTRAMQGFVYSLLNEKLDAAGIRPDLFMRVPLVGTPRQYKYVFIENKTTEGLQSNQEENYPALIKSIKEKKDTLCEFLLLTSVGSCKPYESAKRFQESMGGSFGMLLWEDVFREMRAQDFKLAGIDVDAWQPFTNALDTVAAQHQKATGN